MTAQQQLASILQYIEETGCLPATSGNFLRDHGPAIAGLVTAAMVLERWRIHWSELRFDLAEQVRADLATLEFRKNLVALTAAEWVESPTDKWLETEQLYWRPKIVPPPSAN